MTRYYGCYANRSRGVRRQEALGAGHADGRPLASRPQPPNPPLGSTGSPRGRLPGRLPARFPQTIRGLKFRSLILLGLEALAENCGQVVEVFIKNDLNIATANLVLPIKYDGSACSHLQHPYRSGGTAIAAEAAEERRGGQRANAVRGDECDLISSDRWQVKGCPQARRYTVSSARHARSILHYVIRIGVGGQACSPLASRRKSYNYLDANSQDQTQELRHAISLVEAVAEYGSHCRIASKPSGSPSQTRYPECRKVDSPLVPCER